MHNGNGPMHPKRFKPPLNNHTSSSLFIPIQTPSSNYTATATATNPSPFAISYPNPKPAALKKCVALLQLSTSLARTKQIHAHSIRFLVPLRDPLLAKHLIFSLVSLSSPDPTTVLPYAHRVFIQVHSPNIFTINTMIRAHAESSDPRPALAIFTRFYTHSDTHTYPFTLKACAKLMQLRDGEVVHSLSVRDGLFSNVFVQNTLVHFYSACGVFEDAHKLFDEMTDRTIVTWNSIINGFALNGRPNEALTLFRQMMAEDEHVEPDGFTMVSLLCACAEMGALALGRRTHVYLFKRGFCVNVHVGNALVDLYAKCGRIEDGRKVFDEMVSKNVVSWTSMIVGLAVNGFGKEALDLFGAMERERLRPTEITIVGVLYACSHCGLVNEGFRYFDRMNEEYNVVPKIEHYGCMVDLLGRAGLIEEAHDYITRMPMEPNAVIWRTLLGACAMHKKLDLGEMAWSKLKELDPGHSGDYVLLSNLYASAGRWRDVQELRRNMLKGGVKKNPGRSLLEVGNCVHEFVMGDRSHPQSDEIREMLEEIGKRLRKEGYEAKTSNVLADIEEEEKETALGYHSERLAIAFALISTPAGVPIRIVKNLRVCEDCHRVTKLISKVYEREIVVRDRSRFHHFKDGLCSCKDYW